MSGNVDFFKELKAEWARYSITSPAFNKWKETFKKRSATFQPPKPRKPADPNKPAKPKPEPQLHPVSWTLAKVKAIKLKTGDSEILINNLLYACFQAKHSKEPANYSVEPKRKVYKDRLKELPDKIANIQVILDYINDNNDIVSSALEHSPMSKEGTQQLMTSGGHDCPRILKSLLIRLKDGFRLMQTPEHPGLLDLSVDYAYGPLLLFNSSVKKNPSKKGVEITKTTPEKTLKITETTPEETVRITETTQVFATGNKPKVIELGLIFHLTYLLRFFSGIEKREDCQSRLDNDNQLVVSGPMLRCGRSHRDIVAHLYNATFKDKLTVEPSSGENISERLDHLLNKPLEPTRLSKGQGESFKGWDPEADLMAGGPNTGHGTNCSEAGVLETPKFGKKPQKRGCGPFCEVEFYGWEVDPAKIPV